MEKIGTLECGEFQNEKKRGFASLKAFQRPARRNASAHAEKHRGLVRNCSPSLVKTRRRCCDIDYRFCGLFGSGVYFGRFDVELRDEQEVDKVIIWQNDQVFVEQNKT